MNQLTGATFPPNLILPIPTSPSNPPVPFEYQVQSPRPEVASKVINPLIKIFRRPSNVVMASRGSGVRMARHEGDKVAMDDTLLGNVTGESRKLRKCNGSAWIGSGLKAPSLKGKLHPNWESEGDQDFHSPLVTISGSPWLFSPLRPWEESIPWLQSLQRMSWRIS